MFVDELDEIVAVYGRVVEKGDCEIAAGGFEAHEGSAFYAVRLRNAVGSYNKTTCPTRRGKAG
jgi:hypothetical protein